MLNYFTPAFKAALASDRSQIYTYDLSNNPQINLTLQDLVNDKIL